MAVAGLASARERSPSAIHQEAWRRFALKSRFTKFGIRAERNALQGTTGAANA